MEVNGTRNCLVTDTELFNSGGVEKLAYFPKKWSIPLNRFLNLKSHSLKVTFAGVITRQ